MIPGDFMKILVIPDVHLRSGMFTCAAEKLDAGLVDKAICLMDLPDDWGRQSYLNLYEDVYAAALSFCEKYPNTLWCKGNHDMSYIWKKMESGFSAMAIPIVINGMNKLERAAGENMQFVHRVDNVLFSHGGIMQDFVRDYVGDTDYHNVDKVVERINGFDCGALWNDYSPLWYRPNKKAFPLYKKSTFLQVVGHTPVTKLEISKGVLICDTFSTYSNGDPVGPTDFVIVDTVDKTFETVPSGYVYPKSIRC